MFMPVPCSRMSILAAQQRAAGMRAGRGDCGCKIHPLRFGPREFLATPLYVLPLMPAVEGPTPGIDGFRLRPSRAERGRHEEGSSWSSFTRTKR
jgi:hypothetical protein